MLPPSKRLHYFDHQFLRVDDFTDEQAYHLGMRRAHNRLLHTWGVAQGLSFVSAPGAGTVTVAAGVALDAQGRELVLGTNTETQDLGAFANQTVFVTLSHAEDQTDYTAETGAEGYRRVTEGAVLAVHAAPPDDPSLELVLGRVRVDGAGKVSGMDDGDGNARRRVASAVGGELEARTLNVSGASTLAALAVSGSADVSGALRVTGAGSSIASLAVPGRVVAGASTRLAGLPAGTGVAADALVVVGDSALQGTLAVTGFATFAGGGAVTGGRLSIGRPAADAPLHLAGGSDVATTEGDLKIGDANNRLKIGIGLSGGGAGDVRIRAQSASNRLVLGSGTADVLTVLNGNVGVGTLTPANALHVPERGIQVGVSATATDNFYLASDTASGRGLRLYNGNTGAGTHLLTVTAAGNVGVGTNNPQQNVSVARGLNLDHLNANAGSLVPGLGFGPSSGEGISSRRTAGTNQNGLDLWTANAVRLSITNAGLVGVGTQGPTLPFHVIGRIGTNPGGDGTGGLTVFPPDGSAWWHVDNPGSRLRVSHGVTPGVNEMFTCLQNGNFGIGTTAPITALQLPERGVQIGVSATVTDNFHFVSDTVSGRGLRLYNGNYGSVAHLLTVLSGGNVGVGVNNPQQNLSVARGLNLDQLNANAGTMSPGLTFGSASGEGITSRRTAGNNQYGLDLWAGNAVRLSVTNAGRVGIGTQTPSYPVQVVGRIGTTIGGDGFGGLTLHPPDGSAWWHVDNPGGRLRFSHGGSPGVYEMFTCQQDGSFGIGTTTPSHRLHVVHSDSPALFENTGNNCYVRFATNEGMGNRVEVCNRPGGTLALWVGTGGDSLTIAKAGNVTMPYYLTVGNVTANPGTGGGYFSGNLWANQFYLRTGAKGGYVYDHFVNRTGDVVEQGDVVVLAGDAPADRWAVGGKIPIPEVDLCTAAYQTGICGIVDAVTTDDVLPWAEPAAAPQAAAKKKGKRGRAAAELEETPADAPHPLARLAAPAGDTADPTRVGPGQMGAMVTLGAYAYCKVDADLGAIAVGDLLTTSPTPGHAQKADPARAAGSVIGKAMGTLKSGRGKIPVLVTLG